MSRWQRCKAFLASLLAGAMIGFAFGFTTRGSNVGRLGLLVWLENYGTDAVVWTVIGAFLGVVALYLGRLLHSN